MRNGVVPIYSSPLHLDIFIFSIDINLSSNSLSLQPSLDERARINGEIIFLALHTPEDEANKAFTTSRCPLLIGPT